MKRPKCQIENAETRKLLILTTVLILLASGTIIGTQAYFSGTEQSTDNILCAGTVVATTLLNDGFEGTPWDDNWDGNGTTDWTHDNQNVHSGSFAAECTSGDTYLTTDNLDTTASTRITISFWFRVKDLNKGPLYVQIYDGNSYNNLYNIFDYPSAQKNTYYQYTEIITDSQYFRSDFRLRFDGSGVATDVYVDDVLITKDDWQQIADSIGKLAKC